MKILKITIISLFITLSSCSKMDTNTGSGKVRIIKEFNNWIVDKTTSEQTLDEKIEFQLDSITSEVKKLSLYPDELKMEVLNKTEIDLKKMVDDCWIPSGHTIVKLSEKTKTAVISKFKADNISFQVLALKFKNRITDNEMQFEYLNVLFDQNGDYTLLANPNGKYMSNNQVDAESRAYFVIKEIIIETIKEINSNPGIEQTKTDANITYLTKEEFGEIMPSGRKDFMEHNLEWIEKTRKEDTENIKNDKTLNSKDKAEYLKEIENDYAKRIEGVKLDGECRLR